MYPVNIAMQGRYILSQAAPSNRQELRNALQAGFPQIAFSTSTPPFTWQPQADAGRTERDLGVVLTPITTTFIDQARSLLALGLAHPKLRN